jgi:hypothetical protein
MKVLWKEGVVRGGNNKSRIRIVFFNGRIM